MSRLEQAGATVFAPRARTELEATGVHVRRTPDTSA